MYDISMVFIYVLTLCLYWPVFSNVLGGWESSREAVGDAWGIIEGQLEHHWIILERSRERMITCDVI